MLHITKVFVIVQFMLLETEDVTVNTAETTHAENRRESHEQEHVIEISDTTASQGNELAQQGEALELDDL